MTLKTKSKEIVLLLGLISCSLAYADTSHHDDLYQINVIIFEHITAQSLSSEMWPAITNYPDIKNSIKPELLPDNELELGKQKRILQKNKAYKILFSASWLQQIPKTNKARPTHIFGDQINGTITINRRRFFNIDTNLILTEAKSYLNSIGPGNYAVDNINNYKNFQLHQCRRMRSNELNYFDHALFGMLIKINKYQNVSSPHRRGSS